MVITESGMNFGVFPDNAVFCIEKYINSDNSLGPKGIKSCEFVLRRGNVLYFIEAKTSCPNAYTAYDSTTKEIKYEEYINDITEKIRHSLVVYASILLRIRTTDIIPEGHIAKELLSESIIKPVLVVKNAKTEWLIPLQEKLNCVLEKERRLWHFTYVYVINEETARNKRLVI